MHDLSVRFAYVEGLAVPLSRSVHALTFRPVVELLFYHRTDTSVMTMMSSGLPFAAVNTPMLTCSPSIPLYLDVYHTHYEFITHAHAVSTLLTTLGLHSPADVRYKTGQR